MKQKAQFRSLKKTNYAVMSIVAMFVLGVALPALILFSSFGLRPQPADAAIGFISVGGRFAPGLIDIFTPTTFPPCGFPFVKVIGPHGGTFLWGVAQPYNWFAKATTVNPPPAPHVGLFMLGMAIPNPVPPCLGVPILISAGTGCSMIPGVRCDIAP